jgi:hypothetical protein
VGVPPPWQAIVRWEIVATVMTMGQLPPGQEGPVGGGPPQPTTGGGGSPPPEGGAGGGALEAA